MQPDIQVGDFVAVKINDATQNTLFCEPIEKIGVQEFHDKYRKQMM